MRLRLACVLTLAVAAAQAKPALASVSQVAVSLGNLLKEIVSRPTIFSISPSQGPIAGGTVVTISGLGLASASTSIDGNSVAPLSRTNTQIRFTAPAHDNGYALVKVSNSSGDAYQEFLYVPPRLADLPPGYITTVAGVGIYQPFHVPAKDVHVVPWGLCTDPVSGAIYMINRAATILRIRPDGILEPYAGTIPPSGQTGDGGLATAATLSFARSCAVDGQGTVYTGEGSSRVRRIDAISGIITTIAGDGTPGNWGDGGPALQARVRVPTFFAVEPDGTLYFIDSGNARIRRITPNGIISTVAGTGVAGYSGDEGPATQAQIEDPAQPNPSDSGALAVDPGKFLYLAETIAGRVRRIDLHSGIISTFLPSAPARFTPRALAVNRNGNVFVGYNDKIVECSSAGETLATWGVNGGGFSEDGALIGEIRLAGVWGITIDSKDNILFSMIQVPRVQRINLGTGMLENIAGIAPKLPGVPGRAVGAAFQATIGDLAVLPSGDLLFGSADEVRLLRIGRDGQIQYAGGTGTMIGKPPGEDVSITEVATGPVALESDGEGGYYCTDTGSVFHVDSAGRSQRIAGAISTHGYSGDGGSGTEALLTQPWDLALDPDGSVFIADTNNNRIRRVDRATGVITTVAGAGPPNGFEGYGRGDFCGDGGPALDACFNTPYALTVDSARNIYVYDAGNGRVRRIDPRGTISTFIADQPVTGKIITDASGGLFINGYDTIRRFLPDGSSWNVAGTPGNHGFSGDGGSARASRIWTDSGATGIAIDAEGNLFFQDAANWRIRAVRFGAVLSPPDPIVSITQGAPQSAPIRSPFAKSLELIVQASWGTPAPGVRVDFTAPSSGASCLFPNVAKTVSALTDKFGKASTSCTANGTAGGFTVTAKPLGSTKTASFSLTSTP